MANLSRTWKWVEYAPDIGDNRELAQPFKLKVKSGLTRPELAAFEERLRAFKAPEEPDPERRAELAIFEGVVEMGADALVVGERRVATLGEFLGFVEEVLPSAEPIVELINAVRWFNSVEGARALFYERLSGGSAFTTSPTSGKAAGQRAAQAGGNGTSPGSTKTAP